MIKTKYNHQIINNKIIRTRMDKKYIKRTEIRFNTLNKSKTCNKIKNKIKLKNQVIQNSI